MQFGGEKGIRTPGWFDPSHAFQACAFDRSAISPISLSIKISQT